MVYCFEVSCRSAETLSIMACPFSITFSDLSPSFNSLSYSFSSSMRGILTKTFSKLVPRLNSSSVSRIAAKGLFPSYVCTVFACENTPSDILNEPNGFYAYFLPN